MAPLEPIGQHRDHAARKVHRSGTRLRFLIQRRARFHVMADVGDRDDQTPALARDRLAVHGIVEIPRVFAIDRDQRDVAQIDPALAVALADLGRQRLRLLQGRLGKLVGHRELAYRNLDLHARVFDLPEDFDHPPDRLNVALRLLDDLDHDHLPGARLGGGLRWHQDVVLDPLILRHDDRDPAFVQQPADQPIGPPFNHFDDFAQRPPATVRARHPGQHPVRVQYLAHLVVVQHQVGTAVVPDQQAMAFAVALHLPRQQIGARGHQQQAGPVAHDAAVSFELAQCQSQHAAALLLDSEAVGQFLVGQRRARGRQRVDDGLRLDHRIGMLFFVR
jgi:hypothetical protein